MSEKKEILVSMKDDLRFKTVTEARDIVKKRTGVMTWIHYLEEDESFPDRLSPDEINVLYQIASGRTKIIWGEDSIMMEPMTPQEFKEKYLS